MSETRELKLANINQAELIQKLTKDKIHLSRLVEEYRAMNERKAPFFEHMVEEKHKQVGTLEKEIAALQDELKASQGANKARDKKIQSLKVELAESEAVVARMKNNNMLVVGGLENKNKTIENLEFLLKESEGARKNTAEANKATIIELEEELKDRNESIADYRDALRNTQKQRDEGCCGGCEGHDKAVVTDEGMKYIKDNCFPPSFKECFQDVNNCEYPGQPFEDMSTINLRFVDTIPYFIEKVLDAKLSKRLA